MEDDELRLIKERLLRVEELLHLDRPKKVKRPLVCPNGHGEEYIRVDHYSTGEIRYTCIVEDLVFMPFEQEKKPIITCPNGHSERFEDFGRTISYAVAYISSADKNPVLNGFGEVIEPGYKTPEPYFKQLKCLTCQRQFEARFNL